MPRYNGGFIGTDGLDAPDQPTGVTASAANSGELSVAFTAPTDTGTSDITGFVAQVSTDGTDYSAGSGTGSSSPITVSSLSNGTNYTAKVWAINAYGTSAPSDASSAVAPSVPQRAFWFGRTTVNVFYSNIATTGNTTDWGYAMSYAARNSGTASSATRAVQCGYDFSTSAAGARKIEQLNLASAGAGTNFGELSVTSSQSNLGFGNSTRGILSQGYDSSAAYTNVLEYVTIASAGDGTDFGDMTIARILGSACASTTRGVMNCGFVSGSNHSNVMDYVTIGSTGNATDFGDLSGSFNSTGSCSNSTRGIIAGGDKSGVSDQMNEIQYITIASTGNTSDFGDLTHNVRRLGAGASATRALFAGEYQSNANGINYITIGSTGNAQDFGDLTNNETDGPACASTAHGGIS